MTVYSGVDLHVQTQTVCWCDPADGEVHQRTLDHQRDDIRAFYLQFPPGAIVGVESSGYTLWFHQLVEETGHPVLVGDALAIRQFARRRQKNDRRDAELLLDLLLHGDFPAVHVPCPASREVLSLLRYRHRLVRIRTMLKNGLQAVALSHRLRLGPHCSALPGSSGWPRCRSPEPRPHRAPLGGAAGGVGRTGPGAREGTAGPGS